MTNGRRKKIPLLWGAVSERALPNGFSFNIRGCGGGGGNGGGWGGGGEGGCELYQCLQKYKSDWKGCTHYEGQRNNEEMSQ